MSPHDSDNPHLDAHAQPPIGPMLRRAADDELTEQEASEVAAHLDSTPRDAERIAFERSLRSAVSRAMSSDTAGATIQAPEALAARISAAIAAQASDQDVSGDGDEEAETLSGEPQGPIPFRPAEALPSTRHPRLFGAMAAVLLLGVIGVLATTIFRNITGSNDPMAYRNQLAGFVTTEHLRVTENEAAGDAKWTVHTPDEVAPAFEGKLGCTPKVPNCDKSGIKFVGAGNCHLPGKGFSSHMQFEVRPEDPAKPPVRVSVFVKPFNNEMPIQEGITYKLCLKGCGRENKEQAAAWIHDDLLYVLVVEKSCGLTPCSKLFAGMDVPPPSEEF